MSTTRLASDCVVHPDAVSSPTEQFLMLVHGESMTRSPSASNKVILSSLWELTFVCLLFIAHCTTYGPEGLNHQDSLQYRTPSNHVGCGLNIHPEF
jgi:hypothetical protein